MAKKYYAVVRGREGSGIYRDWPTTEKNVKGISGVKFKSFADEASAVDFILEKGIAGEAIRRFQVDGDQAEAPVRKPAGKPAGSPAGSSARRRVEGAEKAFVMPVRQGEAHTAAGMSPSGTMTAYVDGSFRQGYSVYGYGVVILAGGEILETFSGYGSRPEYVTMRNVAGEVLGAVKAMEYAMAKGAAELILYFDYQGIESWARGTWKRNNDLTRGYHEYVRQTERRMKLTFRKVKGHSGDRFNDLADELAKAAVMSSEN